MKRIKTRRGRKKNNPAKTYSNQRYTSAHDYYNQAAYYFKKGEYGRAIEDLNKAIELKPDFFEAYFNRASAYFQRDEYDRAIKDLDKAIELKPDYAETYFRRGLAYSRKCDYDRAIKDYTKAIELKPDYAEAYSNRGADYFTKRDYDHAIKDYTKAIELKPDAAEHWYNRGITYSIKSDHDRGKIDLDEAIRLKPDFAIAYFNRSVIHSIKGDYDRVVEDLDKTIETKPDFFQAYHNKGAIYQEKGDYSQAIKSLDKAIELKPDYAEAYHARGNTYFKKDDYDRAIKDLDKAIELKPGYTKAYYTRGVTYRKKGNYDYAVADLKEACKNADSRLILSFPWFHYVTASFPENAISEKNRDELFKEFLKLEDCIFNIKQAAFIGDKDVVHYSSMKTLKALIKKGNRFYLSKATGMADSTEGEFLFDLIEKVSKDYEKQEALPRVAWIGSFILYEERDGHYSDDVLLFWRLYGKDRKKEAAGCSLVYSANLFETEMSLRNPIEPALSSIFYDRLSYKSPQNTLESQESQEISIMRPKKRNLPRLYKVFYGENEQKDNLDKINLHLGKIKELKKKNEFQNYKGKIDAVILALLDEIRFLFKSTYYKEENEVRILEVSYDPSTQKHFELGEDFRPNKITIGPLSKKVKKWKTLIKNQHPEIEVKKSQIAYRNRSNRNSALIKWLSQTAQKISFW